MASPYSKEGTRCYECHKLKTTYPCGCSAEDMVQIITAKAITGVEGARRATAHSTWVQSRI